MHELGKVDGGTQGRHLTFLVNGTVQHAVNNGKLVDKAMYAAVAKKIQAKCYCK
jgi:hypothetical protein